MNQRPLRQHAAAIRQRKHYQQTRQAHLDFLTAAVMLFHEVRSLGLVMQLHQPEYREFRLRFGEAEECEQKYLAQRRPKKVAELSLDDFFTPPPIGPEPNVCEPMMQEDVIWLQRESWRLDQLRNNCPPGHVYCERCGNHIPFDYAHYHIVQAAAPEDGAEQGGKPCDHCHKPFPFLSGYRSLNGATNYCSDCLNILDSDAS